MSDDEVKALMLEGINTYPDAFDRDALVLEMARESRLSTVEQVVRVRAQLQEEGLIEYGPSQMLRITDKGKEELKRQNSKANHEQNA